MDPNPKVSVPAGFEAVVAEDGSVAVRQREGQSFTKTISFRTTTEDFNQLLPFLETFPSRSWAEAFRWLLGQDGVRGCVASRIRGALHEATT